MSKDVARRVADIYASAAHNKFASKRKMILSHPDIAQAGYSGSVVVYSTSLRDKRQETQRERGRQDLPRRGPFFASLDSFRLPHGRTAS